MTEFIFELGEELKDRITGFNGLAMARVQYLTGCNQYHVTPVKLSKDGALQEGHYFDETRLVRTNGPRVVLPIESVPEKQNKGGPAGSLEPQKK